MQVRKWLRHTCVLYAIQLLVAISTDALVCEHYDCPTSEFCLIALSGPASVVVCEDLILLKVAIDQHPPYLEVCSSRCNSFLDSYLLWLCLRLLRTVNTAMYHLEGHDD